MSVGYQIPKYQPQESLENGEIIISIVSTVASMYIMDFIKAALGESNQNIYTIIEEPTIANFAPLNWLNEKQFRILMKSIINADVNTLNTVEKKGQEFWYNLIHQDIVKLYPEYQ